ncbi:serine/threonine-protein kinase [Fibrobacter succinogenes]|uniref:serine/threonine-protein kinase n=1 Tax=Fibrobacter succinogenes TaxID=833 RepID=UPI00156498EA|nr:serine/threonine-protein kinase [Fibrobacter succinogenes]
MTVNDVQHFPRPFNDNYDLIGTLGKGGMGLVYKALDKKLKREVAFKILDASADNEAIQRFYLEAQAMKELDHQNIVHVFDFGKQDNQLFIAMTYVQGYSLSDVLQKQSKLPFDAIELIVRQIARGLLYAHSKGIVHRDVKPSNIMLTRDNRVYVMDFGISYIQEMEKDRLTKTGMTMGTPEYMSPEQCHGDEVTLQSDIYSMGVILYEMTCGRLPFQGNRPVEIALKHVQEPPPDPRQFRPDMPPGLSELILKCLKKKLNERYHDMQEFLDDCDQVFPQKETHGNMKLGKKQSLLRHGTTSIAEAATKIPASVRVIRRRLTALAISLFPLIILLLVLLMLTYKPENMLQQIEWDDAIGNFEQTAIEADVSGGYSLDNLTDGDLKTAWLTAMPAKPQNPVLTMFFDNVTLITHIGFAVGYQKSVDDPFGDRFRIFKKPKSLTLETKEGFKQKVLLENIKGMQYPKIQAMETSEIKVYLDEVYEADNKDFAISEIRMLGMQVH